MEIETNTGARYTICSIYAPNKNNSYFFDALAQNISDFSHEKIIIGDYNVVLNVEKDRYKSSFNNPKNYNSLKDLIHDYNLSDTWRVRNEDTHFYSWKRHESNQASRIDFALLSKGTEPKCENITYLQGIESDHCALFLAIKDVQHERGKGYWKLNVSLLEKQEVKDEVRRELTKDIESTVEMEPISRWEKIKKRCAQMLQRISRNQASEKTLLIANLSEKLAEMEEIFPLTEQQMEIYIKTQMDLKELLQEKITGIMFRSRARWVREGEHNTSYFYGLEKSRSNAKNCCAIMNEEGQLVEQLESIIEVQRTFYQNLYTSDPRVRFTLKNTTNRVLSEEEKQRIGGGISEEELCNAVKKLKRGKSPGLDGLPAELYQTFWTELKAPFMDLVNSVFRRKILHESALKGVLNLIPKGDKDCRFLKNLRPITLLNVDYKIIEKVIAERIQKVIHKLIHTDQTGFISGRRMAVNIRKILDIMEYSRKENIPLFCLNLDYLKAFDRCEVGSILASLQYFNFPEVMMDWIRILYTRFVVIIQNMGHFFITYRCPEICSSRRMLLGISL